MLIYFPYFLRGTSWFAHCNYAGLEKIQEKNPKLLLALQLLKVDFLFFFFLFAGPCVWATLCCRRCRRRRLATLVSTGSRSRSPSPTTWGPPRCLLNSLFKNTLKKCKKLLAQNPKTNPRKKSIEEGRPKGASLGRAAASATEIVFWFAFWFCILRLREKMIKSARWNAFLCVRFACTSPFT